jgi:hypothetical protein
LIEFDYEPLHFILPGRKFHQPSFTGNGSTKTTSIEIELWVVAVQQQTRSQLREGMANRFLFIHRLSVVKKEKLKLREKLNEWRKFVALASLDFFLLLFLEAFWFFLLSFYALSKLQKAELKNYRAFKASASKLQRAFKALSSLITLNFTKLPISVLSFYLSSPTFSKCL